MRGDIFIVQTASNGRPFARLGIIVAKRVATRAVDRNQAKRLIREVFRADQERLAGRDVLVRVNRAIPVKQWPQARMELVRLLSVSGARQ